MSKGLVAVPVQEIRDALGSGPARLDNIEEQLGAEHGEREISRAVMLLIRLGELEVIPVGEQVSVQLVRERKTEN